MTNDIINKWLHDVTMTAKTKNHEAHMDLISNRVNLVGVPGFKSINYEQWFAQCKHEFENNLIKSIQYDGLKVVAETSKSIMFKTYETVQGSDGSSNAQGIEVILENEDDGKWRVVQERILPDDEAKFDQLIT